MRSDNYVLIVEDEEKIAQILVDFFALEGFDSHVLHSGERVIDEVKKRQPTAVIFTGSHLNVDSASG